jgi:hypothetical protein
LSCCKIAAGEKVISRAAAKFCQIFPNFPQLYAIGLPELFAKVATVF